jgi:hypothetical protein
MVRSRARLGIILPEALTGLGGMTLGALAASAAQTSIGPDSVVNLSTVAAICGGIIWLNVTLNKIHNRLKTIEKATPETWTYNMQRAHALDFKIRNPSLDVPIPPERVPAGSST